MKTTWFAAAVSPGLFLSLLLVFSPAQADGQGEEEGGGKYRGVDIRSGVETDRRCIPGDKNKNEDCIDALEKFCRDFPSLHPPGKCNKEKKGGW